MANEELIEFPRTPHLTFMGPDLRDDKLVSVQDREDFLGGRVTVQEKLDGACIGISYDQQATPYIYNRNTRVDLTSGLWKKLSEWYSKNQDAIFDLCSDKYALFGEWLYHAHTIRYTSLPSFFMVHDVYEKKTRTYFDPTRVKTIAQHYGLEANTPLITLNKPSLPDLLTLAKNQSQYATQEQEGIYLRLTRDGKTTHRAKIVNKAFHEKIAMSKNWKTQRIMHTNKVCQPVTYR
jgi:hypothetical protein